MLGLRFFYIYIYVLQVYYCDAGSAKLYVLVLKVSDTRYGLQVLAY